VTLAVTDAQRKAEAALPNETVVEILDRLREDLVEPLKGLADDNPDDRQVQDLNDKVRQLMERLEASRSDPKESLAMLAQLENAISQSVEEFNIEAMDASLRDLASALENAAATRNASKAIKDGDYVRAAEELEQVDLETMSQREKNAVGNELYKASDAMERRKQEQLAKLTRKLAEEIKQGDCAGCKNTACQFAGICRKQCSRKGMCDKLNCQLAKLGLCKSQCAGACSSCPNKGQCSSGQMSEFGQAQTDQNGFGQMTGSQAAGDPRTGPETNLDGLREKKQISGILGEGFSEIETEISSEHGDEKSSRSFAKKYREYSKQAESILESEPIPLEQRQVIRRYFESIRPNGTDTDAVD
jgi:hypothetical protein